MFYQVTRFRTERIALVKTHSLVIKSICFACQVVKGSQVPGRPKTPASQSRKHQATWINGLSPYSSFVLCLSYAPAHLWVICLSKNSFFVVFYSHILTITVIPQSDCLHRSFVSLPLLRAKAIIQQWFLISNNDKIHKSAKSKSDILLNFQFPRHTFHGLLVCVDP